MAWIKTLDYEAAGGRLRQLYDRIRSPEGAIDDILKAHSLRPHTLEGHMALYKNVLHNTGNTVSKWFLEALGVYVSMQNGCEYCVEHHYAGMRKLVGNEQKSAAIRQALAADAPENGPFSERELHALEYCKMLNRHPASVTEAMVTKIRDAGFDDGQILEINQVAAYFSYANRTVLGLGCTLKNDVLGLSPNSGEDEDWSHG